MKKENDFCVFGRKPLIETLRTGKRLDKILMLKTATGDDVNEIRRLAAEKEVAIQYVPKEKLESIVRKYARHHEPNHQGAIGFLSLIEYYTLDDVIHNALSKGQNPMLLVLDRITDVGNFGAIARSAECLGADALVIPAQGAAQINSEAMKASAGALSRIFVCREKSLVTAIKYLKANGLKVFGADMQKALPVAGADFSIPCAVVLGSEGEGISPEILKLCDERVSIPMAGNTESLNVSVSAGIVLYEAMKQRNAN